MPRLLTIVEWPDDRQPVRFSNDVRDWCLVNQVGQVIAQHTTLDNAVANYCLILELDEAVAEAEANEATIGETCLVAYPGGIVTVGIPLTLTEPRQNALWARRNVLLADIEGHAKFMPTVTYTNRPLSPERARRWANWSERARGLERELLAVECLMRQVGQYV